VLKFKTGDLVRVVKEHPYDPFGTVGQTGSVIDSYDSELPLVRVQLDNVPGHSPVSFFEEEIELIEKSVPKFNIGDRVRVNADYLEGGSQPEDLELVGKEGVIEDADGVEFPYLVRIGDDSYLMYEEELDFVAPARRFQVGDFVQVVGEVYTDATGEIIEDDGDDEDIAPYLVKLDSNSLAIHFDADELQLILRPSSKTPGCNPPRRFKPGDIVRVRFGGLKDLEGEVIEDDGDSEDLEPYTVEFTDGAGGFTEFFDADELELVDNNEKQPKFMIGDRVHYNGAGMDYLAPNIECDGTITEFSDGFVIVKLDKTTDAWAISPKDLTHADTVAPTDEPTFYILWQPGYPAPPTRRFEFREDAEEVAESMARQYGRKFYVLEAVSFFDAETLVTEGTVG
jgi:transcription antitermination factor NusG